MIEKTINEIYKTKLWDLHNRKRNQNFKGGLFSYVSAD